MADIIQARDWLKRGFKVSNESLLEGDHFYLQESTEKDGEPTMMFNGPGWDEPEEAKFDFDDLDINTWFILKEETLSDKIIDDEPHEAVYVEDLKETIKKIKEEIDTSKSFRDIGSFDRAAICEVLDKHFGDKLTK